MPLIDRQVANWWTSTNPESKFRKNLFVSCAAPDGSRRNQQNREFTMRRTHAPAERHQVTSHTELLALLQSEFSPHLLPDTRFDLLGLA